MLHRAKSALLSPPKDMSGGGAHVPGGLQQHMGNLYNLKEEKLKVNF